MGLDSRLILYVDDDSSNRLVFEQCFGRRYQVRSLSSAQEALGVLREQTVAVLVTDQRMPGMSGNELLQRAKVMCPETIRVVITAYNDLAPILQAVNGGLVERYLVKPWDRDELERLLDWAVEAYVIGRDDSQLQLRLLETERRATLGAVGLEVAHALAQPLAFLTTNASRLGELGRAAPLVRKLLDGNRRSLSFEDAELLTFLVDELPGIAADMQQGSDLMRELLQLMRALGRTRPPTVTPQTCDALHVIRYSQGVCSDVVMRAHGRLHFEGPPSLPQVAISAPDLAQVIIHLVRNAAQALEQKAKRGGKVGISAVQKATFVELAVADNGCGMAIEVLARAGQPFFSTREGGSGLGLPQAHRIVEHAGGKLRIASQPDVGTTVTLELPLRV